MEKKKVHEILKAIKDYQGNIHNDSEDQVMAWVSSVLPWVEDVPLNLYEIWVGIDGSKLVEVGEFESLDEAYRHSWDLLKIEGEGVGVNTIEELTKNSAPYVRIADRELYLEVGGVFEEYRDNIYSQIEPTFAQMREW